MPPTMRPGVLVLAALLVLILGQADPGAVAAPAPHRAPDGLAEAILAAAGGDPHAEGLLHPPGAPDAARALRVGEVVEWLHALGLPAATEDGGPADALGLGAQVGPVPLPGVGEPRCFPVLYYTVRGALTPVSVIARQADVDLLVEDRCPNLADAPVHTWEEVTVAGAGGDDEVRMCAAAAWWSDGALPEAQRCGWSAMSFRGNGAFFTFAIFGTSFELVLGEAGAVRVAA